MWQSTSDNLLETRSSNPFDTRQAYCVVEEVESSIRAGSVMNANENLEMKPQVSPKRWESFTRICGRYGAETHWNHPEQIYGNNTLENDRFCYFQ